MLPARSISQPEPPIRDMKIVARAGLRRRFDPMGDALPIHTEGQSEKTWR
jgi:hypothetical protein